MRDTEEEIWEVLHLLCISLHKDSVAVLLMRLDIFWLSLTYSQFQILKICFSLLFSDFLFNITIPFASHCLTERGLGLGLVNPTRRESHKPHASAPPLRSSMGPGLGESRGVSFPNTATVLPSPFLTFWAIIRTLCHPSFRF